VSFIAVDATKHKYLTTAASVETTDLKWRKIFHFFPWHSLLLSFRNHLLEGVWTVEQSPHKRGFMENRSTGDS